MMSDDETRGCDFDEDVALAHLRWNGPRTRGLYLCRRHIDAAIEKYGQPEAVTFYPAVPGATGAERADLDALRRRPPGPGVHVMQPVSLPEGFVPPSAAVGVPGATGDTGPCE